MSVLVSRGILAILCMRLVVVQQERALKVVVNIFQL